MGWLKRRVWTPILGQLKQGLSPRSLAWSVALALAIAVFPMIGATTTLCILTALAFRLNQPTMQLINYVSYPLQLGLLIPFIRLGEKLFQAPRLPLSLPIITSALKADFWGAIKFFWTSVWHACVAWVIVALPLACLLAFLLTPLFRRLVPRTEAAA